MKIVSKTKRNKYGAGVKKWVTWFGEASIVLRSCRVTFGSCQRRLQTGITIPFHRDSTHSLSILSHKRHLGQQQRRQQCRHNFISFFIVSFLNPSLLPFTLFLAIFYLSFFPFLFFLFLLSFSLSLLSFYQTIFVSIVCFFHSYFHFSYSMHYFSCFYLIILSLFYFSFFNRWYIFLLPWLI